MSQAQQANAQIIQGLRAPAVPNDQERGFGPIHYNAKDAMEYTSAPDTVQEMRFYSTARNPPKKYWFGSPSNLKISKEAAVSELRDIYALMDWTSLPFFPGSGNPPDPSKMPSFKERFADLTSDGLTRGQAEPALHPVKAGFLGAPRTLLGQDWDSVEHAFCHHTYFPALHYRKDDHRLAGLSPGVNARPISGYVVRMWACFYTNIPMGAEIIGHPPRWHSLIVPGGVPVQVDSALLKGVDALKSLVSAFNMCHPKPGTYIWFRNMSESELRRQSPEFMPEPLSGVSFGLALCACILRGPSLAFTGYVKHLSQSTAAKFENSNSDKLYNAHKRPEAYSGNTPGGGWPEAAHADDIIEDVKGLDLKIAFAVQSGMPLVIPHRSMFGANMHQVLATMQRDKRDPFAISYAHLAYSSVDADGGRPYYSKKSSVILATSVPEALQLAAIVWIQTVDLSHLSSFGEDEIEYGVKEWDNAKGFEDRSNAKYQARAVVSQQRAKAFKARPVEVTEVVNRRRVEKREASAAKLNAKRDVRVQRGDSKAAARLAYVKTNTKDGKFTAVKGPKKGPVLGRLGREGALARMMSMGNAGFAPGEGSRFDAATRGGKRLQDAATAARAGSVGAARPDAAVAAVAPPPLQPAAFAELDASGEEGEDDFIDPPVAVQATVEQIKEARKTPGMSAEQLDNLAVMLAKERQAAVDKMRTIPESLKNPNQFWTPWNYLENNRQTEEMIKEHINKALEITVRNIEEVTPEINYTPAFNAHNAALNIDLTNYVQMVADGSSDPHRSLNRFWRAAERLIQSVFIPFRRTWQGQVSEPVQDELLLKQYGTLSQALKPNYYTKGAWAIANSVVSTADYRQEDLRMPKTHGLTDKEKNDMRARDDKATSEKTIKGRTDLSAQGTGNRRAQSTSVRKSRTQEQVSVARRGGAKPAVDPLNELMPLGSLYA